MIPTQEQYEFNEIVRFISECGVVEKLPLKDRREGQARLKDVLITDIKTFYDRISWLLDGSYGAGPFYAFKQLTKRSNRRAWLFNTIARLEYGTSLKMAAQLWHSLSDDKQKEINTKLDELINEWQRVQS